MRPNERVLLSGAVALLMGLAVVGCKDRKPAAPSGGGSAAAPLPVPTSAPATEADASTEDPAAAAEFERLPEFSEGIAEEGPDGMIWRKYPSGMKAQVLKVGQGQHPELGQTVWINFVATLPETHVEVDRSPMGKPKNFRLGSRHEMRGLSLAVAEMKPKERRMVYLPAELAYGEKGDAAKKIGPNQALVYEIELVAVTGWSLHLPEEKKAPTIEELIGPVLGPTTGPAGGGKK